MKTIFLLLFLVLSHIVALQAAPEQEIVDRTARIMSDFRRLPETSIPRSVLRQAKGLAIITVVKAGFIFSGKGGDGVVIARTGRGWSGPSFVGTAGAGWGFQAGAQATDFVFVLNTDAAIRAFAKRSNVTLGVDASVAAGPVGRDAHAAVTPSAAIYTYSRTKGLFAGAAIEGAVIATRRSANDRYYGHKVYAVEILAGQEVPPSGVAALHASLKE